MSPPPPTRFQVTPANAGERLQGFLRDRLGISSRQAKYLLNRRSVFVNGKRVWMAKHALKKGDTVEGAGAPPPSPAQQEPLPILYGDSWILAVNKPPDRVSDRAPDSVESILRKQENLPGLRALHRLDRPTSGVVLFNRDESMRAPYLDLFRGNRIEKIYVALLVGQLDSRETGVRIPLDGKTAETNFTVIKRKGDFCRVECRIPTGRQHQIRRHALNIGCRVAGDRHYGQQSNIHPLEKTLPRKMLHAASVTFTCPHRNVPIHIFAPLPQDFTVAQKQMGL
ncbi:MAG: RluA family pseudouridine synthase [Kiritimatiellae bacterium]|jgi:RluA family pseudouridine synthase|nr:RluA family pseudouridine synthase [Kiritimatiellia bacterium]